jgi:hypothetical protein
MKITTTIVSLSFLLLQGCSSFNQGKFNFGLEQRHNAVTNAPSSVLTPKLTYTASFGGETAKPKAQDEMAMNIDSKSEISEGMVLGGLFLLALALKKKEQAPTPAFTRPCVVNYLPGFGYICS